MGFDAISQLYQYARTEKQLIQVEETQTSQLLMKPITETVSYKCAFIVGDRKFGMVDGSSKENAQNAAAKLALEVIHEETNKDSGGNHDSLHYPKEETESSDDDSRCYAMVGNAVSVLNEYSQARSVAAPRYEFTSSGPSHVPTFRTSVQFMEKTYHSPYTSKNKREAKHKAAKYVLQKVKQKERPPPFRVPTTNRKRELWKLIADPLSKLEHAKRRKIQ